MGVIENKNNDVVIDRILRYQNLELVYPLTCVVDISHQVLGIHVNEYNEVTLCCVDCGYKERVPLMFYDDSIDVIIDYQEQTQVSFK